MKATLISILLINFFVIVIAQDREIPYSQSDRDRSIRTEERQNSLDNKIESLRLEMTSTNEALRSELASSNKALRSEMNARLTDIRNLMYIIITGIFGLIGFVIYDRQKATQPLKRKYDRILQVLKEVAESDNSIKNALKHAGLL